MPCSSYRTKPFKSILKGFLPQIHWDVSLILIIHVCCFAAICTRWGRNSTGCFPSSTLHMWSQGLVAKKPNKIKQSSGWRSENRKVVGIMTCHHIDSTVREKIQASTFSNADMNVCGSFQSSESIRSLIFLLREESHLNGEDMFMFPFTQLTLLFWVIGDIGGSIFSKAWLITALSTTEFDNQYVNLSNQASEIYFASHGHCWNCSLHKGRAKREEQQPA